MKQEKRMVGDYEIIYAFHIGDKELVVGENPKANEDEKYMCAYCEWNDILQRYTDVMVSDDYCEIITLYADRLSEQAQNTRKTTFKPIFQGIDVTPLTAENCRRITCADDIRGKIIVIDPDALRREYRMATNQIKLCQSGFGASPNSRGSACYCIDLYTGEKERFDRQDVLGTMEVSQLPQWAALGLEQYQHSQRQKTTREER